MNSITHIASDDPNWTTTGGTTSWVPGTPTIHYVPTETKAAKLPYPDDVNPEGWVEEMYGTDVRELSIVDTPATDKVLQLFKSAPRQSKPEALEACVRSLLADPNFKPEEGRTPEESAYAICNAKEENQMPDPAAEVADLDAMQAQLPEESVALVEIPASPTKWGFDACIRTGMDIGFDTDSSVATCQIIRQDFGDPADPEMILLPDGMKAESLFAAAAIQGGIGTPEGKGSVTDEELKSLAAHAKARGVKFRGQNWWTAWTRRLLGVDRPLTEQEKQVKSLVGRVNEMEKTKEDLREFIRSMEAQSRQRHAEQQQLLTLIARSMGQELPAIQYEEPGAQSAVPTNAVAVSGTGTVGATEAAAEAAAPPAGDPPASTPAIGDPGEKRIKSLEDKLDRLFTLLGGEPETADPALAAGAPTADLPLGISPQPGQIPAPQTTQYEVPAGYQLIPISSPPSTPQKSLPWRQAVDPTVPAQAKAVAGEFEYSTLLGPGHAVSRQERDIARAVSRGPVIRRNGSQATAGAR